MLIVAIVNNGFMFISKIGNGTKVVAEDKIVEALIEAKVSDIEKVLTGALPSEIKNIDNKINSADINKIAAAKGSKREVGIWLVLIVVITNRRSTKVVVFIIGPIVNINSISISIIGIGIENIIRSKIVEILTGAGVDKLGNIDKIAITLRPKREVGIKAPNLWSF